MTGSQLATKGDHKGDVLAIQDQLTVDQMTSQVQVIQQAMQAVMREDEHYGTIPGTNKPTLLKPGAEKLCLMFRLAPTYPGKDLTWHDDGHLTAVMTCRLTHIHTGNMIAEGEGLCSTRESKYAYRYGKRLCPKCGVDAIVRQKEEKGGGWICIGNDKGGCWSRFPKGDPGIENQDVGRVANPDLADQYNTVLKMAAKRAFIAATLNATAASDIFTQDLEDRASPQAEPPAAESRASQSAPSDAGAPPDHSQSGEVSGSDAVAATGTETPPSSASTPFARIAHWAGSNRERQDKARSAAMAVTVAANHQGFDGRFGSIAKLPPELGAQVEARLLGESAPAPSDAAKGGPCPYCQTVCRQLPRETNKPRWICTNTECDAGYQGSPWASFHEDPWKPGGEVEEITKPAGGGAADGGVGDGKAPSSARTSPTAAPTGPTASVGAS